MNVPYSSFCKHAWRFFQNPSSLVLSNPFWSKLSQHFSSLRISFFFSERKRNRKTDEEQWRRRRAVLCLYWKRVRYHRLPSSLLFFGIFTLLPFSYGPSLGNIPGVFSSNEQRESIHVFRSLAGKGRGLRNVIVAYLYSHVEDKY